MSTDTILAIILAAFGAMLIIRALKRRDEKTGTDEKGKAAIVLDYDDSYNIAGVNKHGLTSLDQGRYHGYIMHEKDNPYDENAIAVYKGTSKQVGYLNKQIAASLAEKIDARGGKVPCNMEILREYDSDEKRWYFVGRVQILWENTE